MMMKLVMSGGHKMDDEKLKEVITIIYIWIMRQSKDYNMEEK